jgi:SNF2 family DNA or RNA helicase
MGLGKTVQSIALILSHPHPQYAMTESAQIDEGVKIPDDMARTTLIVGPLALIKQWESELNSKTTSLPRALKVLVHHGPNRTKDSRVLSKYDVVVTTYPIVASEHKTTSEDKPSALYGVRWWRIILDEAHSIKNPSAKGSQACFALRGRFRWCLTGTPIQNNLEELQSLIRFLRIAPYDEMTVWKEQIVRPMKNGKEQLAMDRLKVILGAILLRRTKKVLGEREKKRIEAGEEKGRNEMMNLPPRNVKSVICKFTTHEKAFYDRLEDKTGRALDRLQGADKMDYTGALVLLLRLRQGFLSHSSMPVK